MDNDNPPERNVGARIRVKAEHAAVAGAAFDREGLTPRVARTEQLHCNNGLNGALSAIARDRELRDS